MSNSEQHLVPLVVAHGIIEPQNFALTMGTDKKASFLL